MFHGPPIVDCLFVSVCLSGGGGGYSYPHTPLLTLHPFRPRADIPVLPLSTPTPTPPSYLSPILSYPLLSSPLSCFSLFLLTNSTSPIHSLSINFPLFQFSLLFLLSLLSLPSFLLPFLSRCQFHLVMWPLPHCPSSLFINGLGTPCLHYRHG